MSPSAPPPDTLSPVKQALLELRDLRARLDATERRHAAAIAIVGMGLRFPGGVDSPETFWNLLRAGQDAIVEVPASRWDVSGLYDPDPTQPGKMTTHSGGFLTDIDRFDPAFFGISPREAISLDPQQRLLLEVSWEALERAGQSTERLYGTSMGVFIGISNSDYQRLLLADADRIDPYVTTGTASSVAAGRLAYVLGVHGPALAVDTACSSSLVAIHLAMQSLRGEETDLALAGGVNLILSPDLNINFSRANMLAADGRCKTFDAAADGYGRGEGCAVVVLKRLSDAVADHDPILAVLRGSAINQDGRSGGLTAPNGPAQEAVIRAALYNAGLEPSAVDYVEAHGTGTPLGDPIEVQALAASLGRAHTGDRPLGVGSVKTNIGHLEAAAGVAGLAKVVLALQHAEIPAHLNIQRINPYVADALRGVPVEIVQEPRSWPRVAERPRVAGISSFGLSGTNAHLIVEEAPLPFCRQEAVDRPVHVLCLSARSAPELTTLALRYADYFDAHPETGLADVGFTANTGRAQFEHRLAVQGSAVAQVSERLRGAARGTELLGTVAGSIDAARPPRVAFLFTGQGALSAGSGQQLFETQPIFRAAIERCDVLLRPRLGRSILEVLYPSLFPSAEGALLLDQMRFAQPALFALQVGLIELWRAWGVAPSLVMGHSAGEYAAAYCAGVLSLEDALSLVMARGRLLQDLPVTGEMVAVLADEARVAAAVQPFADRVSVAAINGPQSFVISGEVDAVRSVQAKLAAAGIDCRRLDIAAASHSPLVEPVLEEFGRVAAQVQFQPPTLDMVSSVTGDLVRGEEQTPSYWCSHLRNPVRFAQAMAVLHDQGCRVFVEIGAHPTLLGMGRNCVPEESGVWLPSLRQGRDGWEQILESVSALYVAGAAVDWVGFDRDYSRQRVVLPTYPWARQRYWLDGGEGEGTATPIAVVASDEERWASLTSAAQRQSEQGPFDLEVERYAARWESLDRLATAYMARALRQLGVFSVVGERHSVDTLPLSDDGLRHLAQRWLSHLAVDGWLTQAADGSFVCARALPAEVDPGLEQAADQALAGVGPLLDYVRRCGAMLASVVRGGDAALETLFPDGSYATVEYLYDRWPVARYFNAIVRSAVESAAAEKRASGSSLQILEVGAGTGGTTASVLPALDAPRTTYTFTDVSDFFLGRAQERFSSYPFVQYRRLDLEGDLDQQGYTPHRFDVVVAANVLHATRDLDHTLQQVQALLAPGGILLFYEATHHPRWMDVTTGLISGWQRFDDRWRHDQPLLQPEEWEAALSANGFDAVRAFPAQDNPASVLRQHVMIARTSVVQSAPSAKTAESGWDVSTTASATTASATTASATTASATAASTTAASATAAGWAVAPVAETVVASNRLRLQLAGALPDERHDVLLDYVRQQAAHVLRVDAPDQLGRDRRLLDLGLDSLMAVELRNRLTVGLALTQKLPATLVFDYPSIAAVAEYLDELLFPPETPELASLATHSPVSDPLPVPDLAAAESLVANLSDEEVERLLLGKLDHI